MSASVLSARILRSTNGSTATDERTTEHFSDVDCSLSL